MINHTELDLELNALLAAPGWTVAFSGGIDSTVLLHLMHQWCAVHPAAPPLAAIHVNHGLQPAAAQWQRHCEAICAALALPLTCASVQVRRAGSLEAAAREARYGVFEAQLPPGAVLFMGHHLDDQVETFFLRLLRGAGVEGLAGIPRSRPLGKGLLVRPLLQVARRELERYANAHQLAYVEDPSNDDTAMDRNFLRAQLLPLLASRWPGYRLAVGRANRHMVTVATLLADELGTPPTVYSALGDAGLSLEHLVDGQESVAAARMRMWLRAAGYKAPDSAPLLEFLRQLRVSARDATPRLEGSGYSLQRYRESVFVVPAQGALAPAGPIEFAAGERVVVPGVGVATLQSASGDGFTLATGEKLTLRWRRGGERCRLPGRAGNRSLKTLLQEWHVPPWWRGRLPLLYLGEELLAVGDIARCVSSRYRERAQPGEQLWTLRWERDADAVFD